jgi:diguanylate cyclase (GGDEF)-like protein/PAS domain S-box-containing protein
VDGETGRILDASPALAKLLAWDREALVGRELADLGAEPEVVRDAVRGIRVGVAAAQIVRTSFQRGSGTRVAAEIFLAAFTIDGRSVLSAAVRDLSSRNETMAALQRRVERTTRQRTALLTLSALEVTDFDERLRQILRVDAHTLDVERVSAWSLRTEPRAIALDALYRRSTVTFEGGAELLARDYPAYFEALETGSVVAAGDAHSDSRTREFSAGYLRPNGIGSMLDVPIYVRGELVGVVCHEHVGGAREWSLDEQQFAMSIAQMVSLAILGRERRRAEESVRESERRFRAIVEASPVPMLVDSFPEGRCLYANAAVSALFGVPIDDLVGRHAPGFYDDPADRAGVLEELATQGQVRGREIRLRRVGGAHFWALVSIQPVEWSEQKAMVVGLLDLTERKQMEEALRHAALHDALTGLPNRALFFDHVRRAIARAKRHESLFAVLYVDLDGFKAVNDTLGHEAGDRLLRSIASRLVSCLRPSDVAARLGGDEFGVLLGDLKGPEEALAVAQRALEVLHAPYGAVGAEIQSGASIGIVLSDAEHDSPDAFLRDADAAMYRAKGAGKGRVELFRRG